MTMPDSSDSLRKLRVLVTRPAHQADNLCRLIEARGGKAVRLPLLSIVPVPQAGAARRTLEGARDWDWWIFTSVNAVQHARNLSVEPWATNLAAVGAATAAALQNAGQSATTPLGSYSSEGLLELPQFQQVNGQRILIVTGEDGLAVLGPALRERGAKVELAEVYRRVALPYDGERIGETLRAIDAIVITSGQALDHLLRLTPEPMRKALLQKQLVVPGPRMVEKASELGFRALIAPEKMSDASIVQSLEQAQTT
ncbi:uroporphyrinogen-III synthase [Stenotrophobium rhamnosiphilum]|uniref:Uroporphyrinogen-III synthase n=1 Tax=Stenotrophobium rhamnosiphilum TaxID=2029166 RepID=A0A2T5MG19_9GAMM|nr:uroporphyrinogen-III synthase [Stenotrophobium rhamnosiphilum]PTU31512.1 uroporphyrinogen-III synthase [Stenotrophobium rhamnosiphilum]